MSGGVIPGLQIVHDGILSVQGAHIQRYDAATRSLRETANRLDRFHRTISQRELFWHFGMDVLAVIALFLVGVGFSGALIAGYPATEEFPWLNTAQIKPVLAEGQ